MRKAAKRKAVEITVDDWLSELVKAAGPTDAAGHMTVEEIRQATGRSTRSIHAALTAAKLANRLSVLRMRRPNLAGCTCVVPGYKVRRAK